MNIALCVLVLNEIECLKMTLPSINKVIDKVSRTKIYAIDGGSIDGTVDFLKKNHIEILQQEKKGRGEAFKLAFEKIDADAYIFFSPDGNENVQDLTIFYQYLAGGADLVIASRMMAGASNEEDIYFWRPRKWANLVFNFLANCIFNKKNKYVTDSINGFRAITRDAAMQLSLSASDYTIEYQMSIQAMKKNLKIVEFATNEGPRLAGKSVVLSFPAGIKFVKRLLAEIKNK